MLSPASADRLEANRIDEGRSHCAQDFAAGPTKGDNEIVVDSVIGGQEGASTPGPIGKQLQYYLIGRLIICPGGNPIGNTIGNPIGNTVGNPIGNTIGNTIGHPIGNLIGDTVGNTIGNTIGNPIGNPMGNTIGNTIGNPIGNTLWNNFELSWLS
jgi:hypothetical protein